MKNITYIPKEDTSDSGEIDPMDLMSPHSNHNVDSIKKIIRDTEICPNCGGVVRDKNIAANNRDAVKAEWGGCPNY